VQSSKMFFSRLISKSNSNFKGSKLGEKKLIGRRSARLLFRVALIFSTFLTFLPVIAGPTFHALNSAQASVANTTTAGTDFRLALTPNYVQATWYLFLTGANSGTATITYPDSTTSVQTITANQVTQVTVSSSYFVTNTSGTQNALIKISSTTPITVYGCNYVTSASDCEIFYPTPVLGTDYRALYAKSSYSGYPEFLTLIGGTTNETVTFTAAAAINSSIKNFSGAGDTATVALPANKILYESLSTTGQEFSGMEISSTGQFGLIDGAVCENFNLTFSGVYGACDGSDQMVPPIANWGNSFYSVNYDNSGSTGSGYRIITNTPNTSITISGDYSATTTLNPGAIYQFSPFNSTGGAPNKSISITSSAPILVGHYMFAGTYVGLNSTSTTGDPSMSYLTPYQQFLSSYTVDNPSGFVASFLNLVVPNADTSTVTLDGSTVSSSSFRAISGTSWYTAQIVVATGVHSVSAPLAFGIEIYGANAADSYAYTGGQNFAALSNVASLQLSTSNESGDIGQQVCVPVTVEDSSGNPVPGVRVDATVSGANSTSLNAQADSYGNASLCYSGTNPGTDTVTLTANGYTVTATVVWSLQAPNISYSPSTVSLGTNTAMPTLSPTNTGGASTNWSVSPNLPTGLSINSTTGNITGTPTATSSATNYTITAQNTAGSSTTTISISVTAPVTPAISYSPSTMSLSVDVAINALIPTETGTFPTWSVSPSLPSGLSINAQSGVISGTPNTVTSSANYTVTASNSAGSATTTLTIAVVASAPVISYTGSPFNYVVGTAINTLVPANSGSAATTWSISPSLPAGLAFNGSTGQISGTPSATSSTTTYTVTATNTGGSGSTTLSITVASSITAPVISYATTNLSLTTNTPMSADVMSNSGGPASSITISPSLVSGLSINTTTGLIQGTPTQAASLTTYTITATNSAGSATTTITIVVISSGPSPMPIVVTFSGSNFQFQHTGNLTFTATLTGGNGLVTFFYNNKKMFRCVNIQSASNIATCNWKPSAHGMTAINASVSPSSSSYLSNTSSTIYLMIGARSVARG
jgi:IgGFc binding protein/Bacterial Ig-like domain (group 1)/Putative Ig domain